MRAVFQGLQSRLVNFFVGSKFQEEKVYENQRSEHTNCCIIIKCIAVCIIIQKRLWWLL